MLTKKPVNFGIHASNFAGCIGYPTVVTAVTASESKIVKPCHGFIFRGEGMIKESTWMSRDGR